MKNAENNSPKSANNQNEKPARNFKLPFIILTIASSVLFITTLIFMILFITTNNRLKTAEDNLEREKSSLSNRIEKMIEESNFFTKNLNNSKHKSTQTTNSNDDFQKSFEKSFMQSCNSSSSDQTKYCQCSLDYIKDNDSLEDLISGEDSISDFQDEILEACGDKLAR